MYSVWPPLACPRTRKGVRLLLWQSALLPLGLNHVGARFDECFFNFNDCGGCWDGRCVPWRGKHCRPISFAEDVVEMAWLDALLPQHKLKVCLCEAKQVAFTSFSRYRHPCGRLIVLCYAPTPFF
jgi:hypothetical protein